MKMFSKKLRGRFRSIYREDDDDEKEVYSDLGSQSRRMGMEEEEEDSYAIVGAHMEADGSGGGSEDTGFVRRDRKTKSDMRSKRSVAKDIIKSYATPQAFADKLRSKPSENNNGGDNRANADDDVSLSV